jgi:hypothetical protein
MLILIPLSFLVSNKLNYFATNVNFSSKSSAHKWVKVLEISSTLLLLIACPKSLIGKENNLTKGKNLIGDLEHTYMVYVIG